MPSALKFLKDLVIAAVLLGALESCAARSKAVLVQPSETALDQARAKVSQSKKPVDRTRNYIQLSDVLISFVQSSIREQNAENLKVRLDQYRDAILSAQHTMLSSGRDGEEHPQGYKDLEMVLRHHVRWLSDWKREVPDQQQIDEVIETAASIRKEMLRSLFPMAARPVSSAPYAAN